MGAGQTEIREACACSAKHVNKVGLSMAYDIVYAVELHPKNKRYVGRRLGLLALYMLTRKKWTAPGNILQARPWLSG